MIIFNVVANRHQEEMAAWRANMNVSLVCERMSRPCLLHRGLSDRTGSEAYFPHMSGVLLVLLSVGLQR